MITPRDYQAFATRETLRYFREGGLGNPIVAMPTATGKSVVIADLCAQLLTAWPGLRIMIATHVKELVEQNHSKLITMWPTAPAGIYSAGIGRKEVAPITFAGVASAVKNPERFGRIDLLLVDEAHLVGPDAGTMYQDLFAKLRAVNPAIRMIGYTATPYRLGQGSLTEVGGLFTDFCVDMTTPEGFEWFVSEGYLVPPVTKATKTEFDLSAVGMQRGEYNQKQLQIAVDRASITAAALKEMIARAADRQHWLIFASGIEHTEHVCETLREMGIGATFVHSKMQGERDERIAAFKAGEFRAMVNNGILTTGFDFPAIDLIGMLRATTSSGLWVQMLGRGGRPCYAPGFDLSTRDGRRAAIAASHKQNCLVLDFAGNTRRLGPVNDPKIPNKKGEGSGEAPVKVCGSCASYVHASARVCPDCGAEFQIASKLKPVADRSGIIFKTKEQAPPEVASLPVTSVVYAAHRKEGKTPSLKVTYYCGLRAFSEYWCLEHEGFPKKKARDRWREMSGATVPPLTVTDAIARIDELKAPKKIRVWLNKEYPEVLSYEL